MGIPPFTIRSLQPQSRRTRALTYPVLRSRPVIARLLFVLIFSLPLFADSKNPADYPLRLHIFHASGTTFFHNRVPEEVRGDGRANLFEYGEPRAVDFSFVCPQKVQPSFGFETYPAKWKKKP